MRRGNLNVLILVGCIAVVALAAALAGYSVGVAAAANTPVVTSMQMDTLIEDAPLIENNAVARMPIEIIESPIPDGSIAVPGFERLVVRGRMLDAENIHNPARNNNYFIVSLMLADGTEIFRSGVLAPGQSIGTVELPGTIPQGTHEGAIARYSAFSLGNLSPLNGADINFTLEVLP